MDDKNVSIKQHYIVYERKTNSYWFILPDDTEKSVQLLDINKYDFNKIYIEMYSLYLYDKEMYDYLKQFNVQDMIIKLKEYNIFKSAKGLK